MERWLEIDESSRQDVQVEPDGEVTKAFAWGRDGVIASRDEIELDARVVDAIEQARPIELTELPTTVPKQWRDAYWSRIRAQVHPGERVRSQSFALLAVPLTEVTYGVMGQQQTIVLEGRRMLAPPPSVDLVFSRRAGLLRRLAYVLAALPLSAFIIYMARGSYFVGDRAGPFVAGTVALAAVVALFAYLVVWNATLARRAAVHWAIAAIAPIAAATALVVLAEPSHVRARELIDSGALETAKAELEAIGAADEPELAVLWRDIHTREALHAKSCGIARESAQKIALNTPQRAKASAHADSLAATAASNALQTGSTDAAATELGCASEAFQVSTEGRSIRARISIAAAQNCMRSKDWSCALAKTKDAHELGASAEAAAASAQTLTALKTEFETSLASAREATEAGARLTHERAALSVWEGYLAARETNEPTTIKQLKTAIVRDEKVFARQQELERRQAEAAEKRRIAEETRQRRREEAAERRRAYRPLVCADGSLSPSCVCGGSWRGCCSHHGGVAGCRGD